MTFLTVQCFPALNTCFHPWIEYSFLSKELNTASQNYIHWALTFFSTGSQKSCRLADAFQVKDHCLWHWTLLTKSSNCLIPSQSYAYSRKNVFQNVATSVIPRNLSRISISFLTSATPNFPFPSPAICSQVIWNHLCTQVVPCTLYVFKCVNFVRRQRDCNYI